MAEETRLERLVEAVERVGDRALNFSGKGVDERVFALLCAELVRIEDVPVLGEEAAQRTSTGRFWIVDSIDGTYNYLSGDPNYAICAALVEDREALLSVVHRPAGQPVSYCAERGEGATAAMEGDWRPIDRRPQPADAPRIVGFGIGERLAKDFIASGAFFERLSRSGYVTRQTGSAALDVCLAAVGRRVGYVQPDLRLWDVIAADLIAREAGLATEIGLEGWEDRPCTYVAAVPNEFATLRTIIMPDASP